MIKKLKRRFILIATLGLCATMICILIAINLLSVHAMVREADTMLDLLVTDFADGAHSGKEPHAHSERHSPSEEMPERKVKLPKGMPPEAPYESRFFTATLDADGALLEEDVTKIVSVDDASVAEYAREAFDAGRERGFVGRFRYFRREEDGHTHIIFLDCGARITALVRYICFCWLILLVAGIVIFFVFLFAASRVVRPIAESYEKQKRFVTDAGHEIKTPLAIIGANLDLLEADCGESESLADIRTQTDRLAALTGELVYLSRMEETERRLPRILFPFSDLVSESAAAFKGPAHARGQRLTLSVTPGISLTGDPEALRRLLSVLLENAVKYTPEGGEIALSLTRTRRAALLTLRNDVRAPMEPDALPRLFERFYRSDASRNSETGGHGIGLSIAQAIVQAHGGKIALSAGDAPDFAVTVTLPS